MVEDKGEDRSDGEGQKGRIMEGIRKEREEEEPPLGEG